PESCAVCHKTGGEAHQIVFNKYADESTLDLELLDVDSVAAGGAFDVTMTFSIMKGGLPLVDADGLPTLDQARFYVQGYDSATRSFPNAMNQRLSNPVAVDRSAGVYKASATGVSFAPENSNAFAYGYIASGHLDTEPGDHIHLYEDVDNDGITFGDADDYESYANVDGCEKCHGEPYLKHGYRGAEVEGLPTFAACKACHMDDRAGGHEEWQQQVDNPVAWGNDEDAELPEYAYTRRLMNPTHMSHAMAFPYPQSMANCAATCHADNTDKVFADEFFTATTCKSCHAVQVRPEEYRESHRAPSLGEIWEEEGVGFHNIDLTCSDCHGGDDFAEYHHGGYDPEIYNADGERYADLYKAEITSLSYEDGMIHIHFTGNTELMTEPMVLVSFYGYDTKDFIVSAHDRDADRNRLGEFRVGGGETNPRFTEMDDSVQGNWHVVMDLSQFPDDVPVLDMIADGSIKKAGVSIRPTVEIDDETVATNGVTSALDLVGNTVHDDYFMGANATVDVTKCNACHDALATTFHSADRGGDITLCKQCHWPGQDGSHLDLQSRGLASYVHAFHRFQWPDTDELDFSDNVFLKRYCEHTGPGYEGCDDYDFIGWVFPYFTIMNCEACHNPGTYNPPDQSESLPVRLSDSFQNDIDGVDTMMRKIGDVPAYITGPAGGSCGG
ncbi:MAG: multiheme c-type cytochrome, partial [Planctomycetota bacterium]